MESDRAITVDIYIFWNITRLHFARRYAANKWTHRLTNMHPRSPTCVSRRINYAPYSRPTPRIADKELFIERCGGRTRGCQWASLDNKRRNTRKKKPTPIKTSVEKSSFFPLLTRGESPRPDSFRTGSSLATLRHPRSRQRDP